jgi:hypothetical protein
MGTSGSIAEIITWFNLSSGNDVYTRHAEVANLNAWAHLICQEEGMKIMV